MAYRFLVVDDTNFMRKMATECLRQFGYEVVGEAADGKEAIRLYDELRPDVVLMDLTMPEMNGVQAIKSILGMNPDAVILICTASNEKGLVLEAMDAGAKGYLMKPFNTSRLQEVIRKYAEPYLAAKVETEAAVQAEEAGVEAEVEVKVDAEVEAEIEAEAEVKAEVEVATGAPTDAVTQEHTEALADAHAASDRAAMEIVEEAAAMAAAASEVLEPEPMIDVSIPTAEEVPAIRHSAPPDNETRKGRTRLKSFVSSIMCQWQEDKDGETVAYSVICTENEDKLVIERTSANAEKQVLPFTLQGFRELAGWLDDHLGAQRETARTRS